MSLERPSVSSSQRPTVFAPSSADVYFRYFSSALLPLCCFDLFLYLFRIFFLWIVLLSCFPPLVFKCFHVNSFQEIVHSLFLSVSLLSICWWLLVLLKAVPQTARSSSSSSSQTTWDTRKTKCEESCHLYWSGRRRKENTQEHKKSVGQRVEWSMADRHAHILYTHTGHPESDLTPPAPPPPRWILQPLSDCSRYTDLVGRLLWGNYNERKRSWIRKQL